jgi:hypothetical protein
MGTAHALRRDVPLPDRPSIIRMVRTRIGTLMLAVVLSCIPLTDLRAACECPGIAETGDEPGVLWRGEESIGLAEIAALAAPVLWYTSDEPLLLASDRKVLPDPHPCDAPTDSGVVYYGATEIRLRTKKEVSLPAEADPEFFDKVASFTLTYYFYYRRDIGLEPHTHDIEVTQLNVLLERSADGCHEVRVSTVVGLAHGVHWYNNILEVERDTRFPITILVEEGKHASCPDRNADGLYTPGYDVTHRVNDAWGVRDVLSTGFLSGSDYTSAMTKTRELSYRMLPPRALDRCPGRPSRFMTSDDALGRYALRAANQVPACDQVAQGEEKAPEGESAEDREARMDRERIAAMMKDHHFGNQYEPTQFPEKSLRSLAPQIRHPSRWVPSVSLRHDGPRPFGVSFVFRGLDGGLFWACPKVNLARNKLGLDLLITPSASQWSDPYFTIGADRFSGGTTVVDGEEVDAPADWNWATEAGVKFRFRVPEKVKPFLLTYDFGGVRFGMRKSGFDDLERFRLIAEIGAGVW